MPTRFEDDPEWQEARRQMVDEDYHGKDHNLVFFERVQLAARMRDIEESYERKTS